ncbi:unnamed protein product [Vicia faba]|uniref:Uncharacterized protein n=1 Tax=Vicia faba TaxID=3906 RepID=A0AAV0ZTP4_VICFA|nr:unnamed protein product [Vicia faba]
MNWGREAVAEYGLQDIGFDGYPFTWTNGRKGKINIQCRLDRGFANEAWISRLRPIKVTHLLHCGSYHAEIRIKLESFLSEEENKCNHIFKFEDIWARDDRCEGLVEQNWKGNDFTGYNKVMSVSRVVEEFKEYRCGNIQKDLIRIEEMLKEEANWDSSEDNIWNYKAIESQRQNLLKVEEIMWRKHSRALWL